MNRYSYLLAYTIPLATFLSLEGHGILSFIALAYAFGLLPLLELLLPAPTKNPDPESELKLKSDPYFDWVLYSMVPLQLFLVFRFGVAFSSDSLSTFERIGLITALGVSCGVLGINVAHELGHRPQPLDRWLSRILLATSLNWQFYIEHNRGHHKNVATPDDPESARLNESLYAFWVRAIRDAFLNAWKLDSRELLMGLGFEAALLLLIAATFGLPSMLGFMGSALFGILLLQSVNYIEHYGLQRIELSPGRFEPVQPHHSWNANPYLSRAILFELSRHSDHHAYASRKYQILRHHESARQMPTGYPGMILMALVPRLWFRLTAPLVCGRRG